MEKWIADKRENNFWQLMKRNAEVESLTEEQHNILAALANFRHELHTNTETLFYYESDNSSLWNEYDSINEYLSSVSLPSIDLPGSDEFTTSLDYDIDSEGLSFGDWIEKYLIVFGNEMENVNKTIENYLEAIDNQHGTKYAPTGLTRLY